ncbi:MAG: MoxR family ATPase [Planctomycetota bacterium]
MEATSEAQASVMPDDVSASLERLQAVVDTLGNVIRGKDDVIASVLTALLAEGSVLLEDVPGVGKTTLAKAVARLIDLDYQRIQCTPDLLPADILGGSIFQPATGEFEFRPGPVFCNLLVADEVNRASPRTQSALLEAMAESQVTIDTQRHSLKRPFMVIATQNPAGFEGTFPLPESQLDRFLFRLSMQYPEQQHEVALLLDQADHEPIDDLQPIMSASDLLTLQAWVRRVKLSEDIARYVVSLASATRQDERIAVGCSPRGSKMVLRASQAAAVMSGRDYVLPDDVQSVAVAAMAHRLRCRSGGKIEQAEASVSEAIAQTPVPA